jgi:hypothetical protein
MFLTNFNEAKYSLISHLQQKGMTTEEMDDIVELSLRMANGLVQDTTVRMNNELQTVTNYVGAFKYELSTQKPEPETKEEIIAFGQFQYQVTCQLQFMTGDIWIRAKAKVKKHEPYLKSAYALRHTALQVAKTIYQKSL